MEPQILIGPRVKCDVPFENAGKLLYDQLKNCDSNSVAIIDLNSNVTVTYGELLKRSLILAEHIKTKVEKDSVIAAAIENSSNFFVAFLASLFLAVPIHLINPYYTKYELKQNLKISRPKLFFASDISMPKLLSLTNREEIINLDDFNLKDSAPESFIFDLEINIREHVAVLVNTSGTTGLPKAGIVTHEAIRMIIVESGHCPPLTTNKNEATLINVPVFHLFGLSLAIRGLCQGGGMVIMDRIRLEKIFGSIQLYRIKTLYLSPAIILLIADYDLTPYDLSFLERIVVAGSMIEDETLKKISTKLNVDQISSEYGMTECNVVAVGDGNSGRAWYEQQIKIVHLESRAVLGPMVPGEICVKSSRVKGYYNNEESTKNAFDSDGFFITGDVGYYDENGCIHVTDRAKEIIKYTTYQVSPAEIERVILKLKGVRDVAVAGKAAGALGSLPMAFVVKNKDSDLDEKQIVDHVAAYVCNYKHLRGGVKFVDLIPKNLLGKIQRKSLVQLM